MGKNIHSENPVTVSAETFRRYDMALEVFACRLLAEPYNASSVEHEICAPMLQGFFGDIIAECKRQYHENRQYTAQSVAIALGRDKAAFLPLAKKDTELDAMAALQILLDVYGQWVEVQIAESVATWLRNGLTSEEIQVAASKVRSEKGLSAKVVISDGRAEFEKQLLGSLDGKAVSHPVRPHLESLRKHVEYYEPGDYIICAGRTGMGKSFFGLNEIFNTCAAGIPALLVNLENQPAHIQKRLWQMKTGVKFSRSMPNLSQDQIGEYMSAWDAVKNMPAHCVTPSRNISAVTNAIRRARYEKGIELAVIDYIQLLRSDRYRGDRINELADISSEIRMLSLDLQIPVMGICQMNRETERTADKRPTIAGLRGSGDIEQDATSIFLLYRPEYYGIFSDEDGTPYQPGYAEVIVGKGRETGPAVISCRFDHVRGYHEEAAQSVRSVSFSEPRSEQVPF